MSDDFVVRPQAGKKKIHNRNEFELCYMRHQYIRKVNYNPSKDDMEPFQGIIKHLAKNTYYTYRNLFSLVGFELDDLINIGRIHLVSFLGLFSLEKLPEKYEHFIGAHYIEYGKNPDDKALLSKNKANFTLFLKQRMEDVVRISRQKARNIKGLPTEEFYAFCGPNKPPRDFRSIMDDYGTHGFKKIDMATFKSIKKRSKTKDKDVFQYAGYWYVAVMLDQRPLSLVDFSGAGLDPRDSIHNRDPEEILFHKQETEILNDKQAIFKASSNEAKVEVLNKFIGANEKNVKFEKEVAFARKFVIRLEKRIAQLAAKNLGK